MKYAHIGDCHIGSWVDPKMRHLNSEAFSRAVDKCIAEKVDFILLTGDLFNSSLPAIDSLKTTVKKLRSIKNHGIPAYIIPGSHDFSPTGKTMIDVLCEAELCINVVKGKVNENKLKLQFTVDPKTGAKITGMLGKKGMLEKTYYESLDNKEIEEEDGYKIFMFHTALTELKPKSLEKMDSAPVSLLPKGFDYYAGGHVHIVQESELEGYKKIVYPGPIFPNNFREIEELSRGGFYIVEDDIPRYVPIQIYNTHKILIKCDHKSVEAVRQELLSEINKHEFINTIVLIRLGGVLSSGKQSDLDFREIFELIYGKGAYFVMKNTSALASNELEEIKVNSGHADDIESTLIQEHIGQIKVKGMDIAKEEKLTKMLISMLENEKQEGERVYDFEARIVDDIDKIIKMG